MGAKTSIEWTDRTWGPIRARVKENAGAIARAKNYVSLVNIAETMSGAVGPHCERVSHACDSCYADANNRRCLPANGTGLPFDRRSRDLVDIFADPKILQWPLKWRKASKIFVESQSDLFGEFVPDEMIDQVFAVMALCPQHTFQVLTKRPERMLEWFDAPFDNREHAVGEQMRRISGGADPGIPEWPLANVWIGSTTENQYWFKKRIASLIKTPAARRFISAEPLLGSLYIRDYLPKIDQVIAGGESGRHARPTHPDWAKTLLAQCQETGTPFFWKQWGSWKDGSDFRDNAEIVLNDGRHEYSADDFDQETQNKWSSYAPTMMAMVGKKKAGAELCGREWKEFPAVRPVTAGTGVAL
jgi:protein gp37